jgi:hypothetical protein
MLDLSHSGARLQLNETGALPDEFILVMARNGTVRRCCQVIWRAEHTVGVQFLPVDQFKGRKLRFNR